MSLSNTPAIHSHSSLTLCSSTQLTRPHIYSNTKAKNAPTTSPRSALDRGAPPSITDGVAEFVGLLAVVATGNVAVGSTDGDADAEDPETAAWGCWLAHAQTGQACQFHCSRLS